MNKKTKKLSKQQKAQLIAAYLLSRRINSSKKNNINPSPWQTLIGFRNT